MGERNNGVGAWMYAAESPVRLGNTILTKLMYTCYNDDHSKMIQNYSVMPS